ncbi:MAG: ABC transporter permease subunit [Nonomuraea sp.]|nr:ABC transporter permease subunit [Nonomuraea sp.]
MIAAEWLKLRSVSSTWYALGAAALTVVLGALWSLYVSGRTVRVAAAPELVFVPVVEVSLAVLGVLAASSEYSTGTIRSSLAAVPGRGAFLAAKAGVVAAITAAWSGMVLLVTYAVSRLIGADVPFAGDLTAALASWLSVVVLALVGLGLGVALRSAAGGIVTIVVLQFVLPGVAVLVPPPWGARIASLLLPNLVPQVAGHSMATRLGEGFLPPWAALLGIVAYAAVALGLALLALRRRDA